MQVKSIGYDLKSLQVELSPGEQFYCERGALIYYEEGIQVKVDILGGGLGGMLKRVVSGESLVQVSLLNGAPAAKKLMVAGKVGLLPIDLRQSGGSIISRGGYYIASSGKVDFDFKLSLSSFIGGTGLAMQKISGACTVFVDCIGSPVKLELKQGDVVNVDEKSFVCMDGHMYGQFSSNFSGGAFVGGEGLNTFRIAGPGTVYLNSVNIR